MIHSPESFLCLTLSPSASTCAYVQKSSIRRPITTTGLNSAQVTPIDRYTPMFIQLYARYNILVQCSIAQNPKPIPDPYLSPDRVFSSIPTRVVPSSLPPPQVLFEFVASFVWVWVLGSGYIRTEYSSSNSPSRTYTVYTTDPTRPTTRIILVNSGCD